MVKLFPAGSRSRFVDLVCGGMSVLAASQVVGASATGGKRWWRQSGGMTLRAPRSGGGIADPYPNADGPNSRSLTMVERGMIQFALRWNTSRDAATGAIKWKFLGTNPSSTDHPTSSPVIAPDGSLLIAFADCDSTLLQQYARLYSVSQKGDVLGWYDSPYGNGSAMPRSVVSWAGISQ